MVQPRVLLASFAGLRAAEIAALDACDIDHRRRALRVLGKGGKERMVPMHPDLAAALEPCRRGPVIPSRATGGSVRPGTISAIVAVHLRSRGIDRTCHSLRHWFGTETHQQCHDLRVVQELMGHSSIATTEVYVAWSMPVAESAVDGLSLPA